MGGIAKDNQYKAGSHAKVTVADSVVPLSNTANLITKSFNGIPHSAIMVWIQPETYPIYYTIDGTAPATDGSTGHFLDVGALLELKAWENISNFKAIRVGANTGYIKVTGFFNKVGGS